MRSLPYYNPESSRWEAPFVIVFLTAICSNAVLVWSLRGLHPKQDDDKLGEQNVRINE